MLDVVASEDEDEMTKAVDLLDSLVERQPDQPGILLYLGIGDTLRVSITGDPADLVRDGDLKLARALASRPSVTSALRAYEDERRRRVPRSGLPVRTRAVR